MLFAQVREDPAIESYIVNKWLQETALSPDNTPPCNGSVPSTAARSPSLRHSHNHTPPCNGSVPSTAARSPSLRHSHNHTPPCNGSVPSTAARSPSLLCIASGGCTALTLAAQYPNMVIDAIDMSPAQIYLCELKRALCVNYDTAHILHMYQNVGDVAFKQDTLHHLYGNKAISTECYNFWLENQPLLYEGINQCGTFEHIFEEVAKTGDFDKVFSRKNLIASFGENAVKHSTQEFSQHFRGVINTYKAVYGESEMDARKNYFYYQIAYNRYHPLSLPGYLGDSEARTAIKSAKLHFIVGSFIDHLRTSADNSYNIIQTSNITDWLTLDEIVALLRELLRVCVPGGYIIMRRLNSDTALADVLKGHNVEWIQLPLEDTTFFYKEVMVVRCLSIAIAP